MEYVYILLNPNEILPSPESIRSLEEFLKETELIGPEAHPAQSRPAQSRNFGVFRQSRVHTFHTQARPGSLRFASRLSHWLRHS